MLNIIRVIIVGIFVVNCDSFNPEFFTIASLYYYVLTVIFVALDWTKH